MSQYIVCRVSNQFFALSILETNRIIPLEQITKIPDTPSYLMGVMESEGEVLPIVDLSNRFFNQEITNESTAQIIIVYWRGKEVGVAVNEVQNITSFSETQIDRNLEKVTSLNHESQYTAIKSIIQGEDGLILEIDPENLFDMTGTLEIEGLIENYEEYLNNEETAATD